MAIIIVEGCDFSGKSTLVSQLAKDLKAIVLKEERIPYPDQASITEWISLVNRMSRDRIVICDRSVLISDQVYGRVIRKSYNTQSARKLGERLNELISEPTVIFCNPGWDHISKCANDQMEGVKENLKEIYTSYREVITSLTLRGEVKGSVYAYSFLENSYEQLLNYIRLRSAGEDHELKEISKFHEKFGIRPRRLNFWDNREIQEFRVKFLREEVDELVEALNSQDLVKALDALIDLVIVAKGTAHMMGISPKIWASAAQVVQECNMRKIRAESPDQSKRNTAYDIIKPDGWVGPERDLKDILVRIYELYEE